MFAGDFPAVAVKRRPAHVAVSVAISIWSFVRIDQTCLGRSGGFAPVSFPLFHGTRLDAGILFTWSCMAILLGSVTEGEECVPLVRHP